MQTALQDALSVVDQETRRGDVSPEAIPREVEHLHLALQSLWAACERLEKAHVDESLAYAAVGEALYWAVVCDDGYRLFLNPDYEAARDADAFGRYLRGVRWARNCMTHQPAIVLERHYGTELNTWILGRGRLGTVDHMKWARANEIHSDPRRDFGREEYADLMQDKPASVTVDAVRSWLLGRPLNELGTRTGFATPNLPRLSDGSG